jgi:hypothetical protein
MKRHPAYLASVKPRLIKIGGVWHCGIKGAPRGQYFGRGFKAKEAFDDWRRYA